MKTLYQADDGRIFETETECKEYEALPRRNEYEVTCEVKGHIYMFINAFSKEEAKNLADEKWDETDIIWDYEDIKYSIKELE